MYIIKNIAGLLTVLALGQFTQADAIVASSTTCAVLRGAVKQFGYLDVDAGRSQHRVYRNTNKNMQACEADNGIWQTLRVTAADGSCNVGPICEASRQTRAPRRGLFGPGSGPNTFQNNGGQSYHSSNGVYHSGDFKY